MQAPIPDAMAEAEAGSEASITIPMFALEPQGAPLPNFNDAMNLNLDMDLDSAPAVAFTNWPSELTANLSGDTTSNANNNVTHVQQFPQFDPSALLNPRSTSSKRPASSGGDTDRGRPDPTIAGQVSLVERLHNVQERKKKAGNSAFGGGSALDLQRTNGQGPTQPPAGPAIDLTMSKRDRITSYRLC
jgi:hypothetical protein